MGSLVSHGSHIYSQRKQNINIISAMSYMMEDETWNGVLNMECVG